MLAVSAGLLDHSFVQFSGQENPKYFFITSSDNPELSKTPGPLKIINAEQELFQKGSQILADGID